MGAPITITKKAAGFVWKLCAPKTEAEIYAWWRFQGKYLGDWPVYLYKRWKDDPNDPYKQYVDSEAGEGGSEPTNTRQESRPTEHATGHAQSFQREHRAHADQRRTPGAFDDDTLLSMEEMDAVFDDDSDSVFDDDFRDQSSTGRFLRFNIEVIRSGSSRGEGP